jgi:hypothetical protein
MLPIALGIAIVVSLALTSLFIGASDVTLSTLLESGWQDGPMQVLSSAGFRERLRLFSQVPRWRFQAPSCRC